MKKKIQNEIIHRRVLALKREIRAIEKEIQKFYDSPEFLKAKTGEEMEIAKKFFDLPLLEETRSDFLIRVRLLTGSDLMFSENPSDILSFLEYRNQNAIDNMNSEFPDQLSEKYREEIRHHFGIEHDEASKIIFLIRGIGKNA